MKILAFDTSADILSICLLNGQNQFLTETRGELKHAQTLLPGINHVLSQAGLTPADLDLVVCSRGPGSFTGLRIGMATAKGLSEGTGVPVFSVDTLDALAYPYRYCHGSVIPVLDAKKSRFYAALYTEGRRKTDQLDCGHEELLELSSDYPQVLLTGPGAFLLQKAWNDRRQGVGLAPGPFQAVAASLAVLGKEGFQEKGADLPGMGPVYLRKSDAEIQRSS